MPSHLNYIKPVEMLNEQEWQRKLQAAGWSPESLRQAVEDEEARSPRRESKDAIDLYEVNEAFSGSTVAALRELGLDPHKVNVNGGSVALGHPIGASGCRLLVTLLHEMIKADKKTGLVSLCLGGGEAVAMIVKR